MLKPVALVTGAAGFIGFHVVRQLVAAGHEVAGIGHAGPESRPWQGGHWIESNVDASSLGSLDRVPDLVIHCAGGASVGRSFADPVGERLRTLDSASAVLNFARVHAPHARLVLISSAAVYGNAASQPIAESTPCAPVSPYGDFKVAVEQMWSAAAAEHGLACAIVRMFSVYGEGLRKQLLWDACAKFSAGRADFAGTGRESRDWVHVEDTARLLLLAGRYAEPECPIVNGGSGIAVSVKDVLVTLSEGLGLGLEPRFDGVMRSGDPPHYRADVSRARAWGWSPELGWREGVLRYAHWFRRTGT